MILNNRDKVIKQLKYRSLYRGCKENDLIFTAFISQKISSLNYQELIDLQRILEHNDYDIYKWIVNKQTPPKHINKRLIYMLRTCNNHCHNG